MLSCGRGNCYGIDLTDEFRGVLNCLAAVFFGKPTRLVEVDIDYGDEVALRQFRVNAGVYFAHFACADNRGS
jgi:hypothetical protein